MLNLQWHYGHHVSWVVFAGFKVALKQLFSLASIQDPGVENSILTSMQFMIWLVCNDINWLNSVEICLIIRLEHLTLSYIDCVHVATTLNMHAQVEMAKYWQPRKRHHVNNVELLHGKAFGLIHHLWHEITMAKIWGRYPYHIIGMFTDFLTPLGGSKSGKKIPRCTAKPF